MLSINTDGYLPAADVLWLRAFNQRCGPLIHDAEATIPDIFSDLLPDGFIQLMVRETNRYADQWFASIGGRDALSPSARARSWKDTNEEEMSAFLGTILFMGLVKLPTYQLYWANNWMLDIGMKVISRDRFLSILSFLHCANNEEMPRRDTPNFDKIFKIREVLEMFVASWQEHYYPAREVAVDETVIGFSGTVSFLQYNPNKPHKWGITVWSAAESTTGYVYCWDVYTGKRSQPDPRANNNDGRGAIHWVTWDLLEKCDLLNKGHHVYMDNYFSSPTLFEDLANVNTGACGTLRRNRTGIPDAFKTAKPKKGEPPMTTKSGKCQYISWMDRNLVTLLSTVHTDATFIKRTRSRNAEDGFVEREKPNAIDLYTKYMRGVDLSDQAMWYSLNSHKSLKWWKKIFFGLLEITFTNTLVIWRKLHPGQSLDRNKARMDIVNHLVGPYRRNITHPGPRIAPVELRFTQAPHVPELVEEINNKGNVKRRDCIVCSARYEPGGVRHQTQYRCFTCQLPMCPWPCMLRFHTIEHDWRIKCTRDKSIHKPKRV